MSFLAPCGSEEEGASESKALRDEPRARNLLFILSDQHRGDGLGAAGHPIVRTPRLDRLASEGVLFQHAYVASPLCVPSRASLLSGRYPHQHGCTSNQGRLRGEERTFAEALSEAGFQTLAIGKVHGVHDGFEHVRVPVGGSFEHELQGYFDEEGQPLYGKAEVAGPKYYDARIAYRAVEELERLEQSGERFALLVGFHAPHPPFLVPEPYDAAYDPEAMALPAFEEAELDHKPSWQRVAYEKERARLSDADLRAMIACYWARVAYLDRQVGRVLDALDDLDLAEETLVVYSSDHGENLGDHGLMGKFASFYESEVRVPLVMRLPGALPAGRVVQKPVEQIDVVPTLLELLGVAVPETSEGWNLLPLVEGRPRAARPWVFASIRPDDESSAYMVRTENWKLCYYTDQPGELYNLRRDPGERVNLWTDPEALEMRERLTRWLVERLAQTQPPVSERGR